MLSSTSNVEGIEKDSDLETYLLLLLSDSNLPTGGFVASSGLESFFAHGLLHNSRFNHPLSPTPSATASSSSSLGPRNPNGRGIAPSQAQLSSATLSFTKSTLHSYARSSFPLLARVHYAVTRYLSDGVAARIGELCEEEEREEEEERIKECLNTISRIDYTYHTLLLNHVARRASKAQGIALLTLYSKAFASPIDLSSEPFDGSCLSQRSSTSRDQQNQNQKQERVRIQLAANLVDKLKLEIRRSSHPNTIGSGWIERGVQNGHFPICWAVFSACLGLSLEKAVYLHLFLQARSLFSSSVRLGTLGPYLAHQVMRFQLRVVVEDLLREVHSEGLLSLPNIPSEPDRKGRGKAEEMDLVEAYTIDETAATTNLVNLDNEKEKAKFRKTSTITSTTQTKTKVASLRTGKGVLIPVDDQNSNQGWAWDWEEDPDPLFGSVERGKGSERGFWTQINAPATTYPLGEIVQARHDGLHSRLFNS